MILALYGAGGLGVEILALARLINQKQSRWTKIIFVDDDPQKDGQLFDKEAVYSFQRAIDTFGVENMEFILSVGEPTSKERLYTQVKACGCKLTNLVHPTVSVYENVTLGEGILVQRDSTPPPMSVVGNNVLFQEKTSLGHNLVIGDNSIISSFAFVGGDTVIGKNTYIGPHACLRNKLKIGDHVIVGMGSVVTKDVPDYAVVYGNPARIMRYNENGKVFSK